MELTTIGPPKPNELASYVADVLSILHPPGSVVEIRALSIKGRGRPHNAAGYFRDLHAAGRAVEALETRNPSAIYTPMNRIDPVLYSRSPDQILDYPENTTSDKDIIRRQWLLIDVDPIRPAGIPSSDYELAAAEKLMADVRDWLMEKVFFTEPIEAMSGNGFHTLFPVDTENTVEVTTIIKHTLKAAKDYAEKIQSHTGPQCKVDTSVFNPARITKMYGTLVKKGHHTPERPHRRSHLIYVPDNLNTWGTV